jgi:putative ABC transport system permease protein
VRSQVEPASLVPAIRQTIQTLEPNLPVPAIQPMVDNISRNLYLTQMSAVFTGAFGALALGLAIVGVYGVLAFSIARRTRELGIRMALGATRRQVFALVVREGMTLALAGATLGMAAALLGAGLLTPFLFGIASTDPVALGGAVVLLLFVALLACLIPARRATSVDPTTALRQT